MHKIWVEITYKLTLEFGVSKPFWGAQEVPDCSAEMSVLITEMGVAICQGPDLAHFHPGFTEGRIAPAHDPRKALWCTATLLPLLSSRVSEGKSWVYSNPSTVMLP